MQVGFLGGTGIEAKGLALRFAAAGAQVILGSRSEERAASAALDYNRILGRSPIRGATNKEMLSGSDIVFLTVPFDQAVNAVESCRSDFPPNLVLVDVTVPMRFKDGRAEYVEQEGGSNAETIAARLPAGVDLVTAFKTIPAHMLAETERPLECDVFVCGESPAAKEKIIKAVSMIPTLRPLDAGPLRNARILERMTVLAAQLNRRYKSKNARYRVVGI
jgi:NADPH-dependent F420 reductase